MKVGLAGRARRGGNAYAGVLTVAPQFRRSIKSDGSNKHDSAKPVQIAIPQKDAIAIEPPKKVGAVGRNLVWKANVR